jgi:hypothetical protein
MSKGLTSPRWLLRVIRDHVVIRGERKNLSKGTVGCRRVVAPVRMNLHHPG